MIEIFLKDATMCKYGFSMYKHYEIILDLVLFIALLILKSAACYDT